MTKLLEKVFRLSENGTTVKREVVGGVVTFMTMAYIVFVNPAILEASGMPFGATVVATCLAAAFGTLLMGIVANYPFAQAPGMGLNALFAFTLCGVMGLSWQEALGLVALSGFIFFCLTIFKVREAVIDGVPHAIKMATAVGIGLFIAFIGLQDAGIVVNNDATLVGLGDLSSPHVLLFLFGLILTALLMARNVYGALLWGILATAVTAWATGLITYNGLYAPPTQSMETFLKLRLPSVWTLAVLQALFTLVYFDLFDTVGTLVGLSEKAGFMKDGRLPRASRALFADSLATMGGAVVGSSTTTSYIESSSGIAAGARTGLANMVTGLLFLAAIFFVPLAAMIGGGIQLPSGSTVYPVTAPALIIVGYFMMSMVGRILWDDVTEAIPAFLTIILMPLTYSISVGITAGFISYSMIKLMAGRSKDVSPFMYGLSVVLILLTIANYTIFTN